MYWRIHKKQQGLLRWQFLTAIILIIVGLAFDLIFVLIIQKAVQNNEYSFAVSSMTQYFQYTAFFVVYAGCYLLVRGVIKSSNSVHNKKYLKANDFAGILFCVYLICNYIAQGYMDYHAIDFVEDLEVVWPQYIFLVANTCECLAAIITIYVLVIAQRGFLNNWTKWVRIISLIVAIVTALSLQLTQIANIVNLTYLNYNSDAYTYFNEHFKIPLMQTACWSATVFEAAFLPFAMFVMNWRNIAPQRVAY